MNKIIITTILIFIYSFSYSQSVVCKSCGPKGVDMEEKRENIVDGKELETPFNGIIHLRVTRNFISSNISTASFIDDDLIITANHNLMYSPFITKIELFLNEKWIKIKKRHLKIHHYHQGVFHKKAEDIAIIKIKNTIAIESSNYSSLDLTSFDGVAQKENKIYHLTGFPCDRPNILVDKKTSFKEFSEDSSNQFLGYRNLYTCTGDSGAPLWFFDNDTYYLCSIHHGKRIISDSGEAINVGIKITQDVINWINKKIN